MGLAAAGARPPLTAVLGRRVSAPPVSAARVPNNLYSRRRHHPAVNIMTAEPSWHHAGAHDTPVRRTLRPRAARRPPPGAAPAAAAGGRHAPARRLRRRPRRAANKTRSRRVEDKPRGA